MEVEMRLPDRNPLPFFTLPLTHLLAGLIVLTAPPGSSRADDPFIKSEDYSTPALPGTRAAANQASGWRNAFDNETAGSPAGSPPAAIPEAPISRPPARPAPKPESQPGAETGAGTPPAARAGFDTSPIPGHPFSYIIPDPDKFDWQRKNRPGYRFRGMKEQHRNFYNYIMAKRRRGEALSWGERLMIHLLQANRRWPEPPIPNEAARRFMKYLRNKTDDHLNTAENLLLAELFALGVIPYDNNLPARLKPLVKHLQNGHFQARNIWERWFGRVEPWIDFAFAASGADLSDGNSPSGPAGGNGYSGRFPADDKRYGITYHLSGVDPGKAKEWTDRSLHRIYEHGTINGDKIVLDVTPARGDCKFRTDYGDFYTTIAAEIRLGSRKATYFSDPKRVRPDSSGLDTNPCTPKAIHLELPVTDRRDTGSFAIVEHWVNPRYGDWEIEIRGSFAFPEKIRREAWDQAFAEWHRHAEAFFRNYGTGGQVPETREFMSGLETALRRGGQALVDYLQSWFGGPGEDYTPPGQEAKKIRDHFGLGDDGEGESRENHQTTPPPPRKPQKPKKRRRLNPYLVTLRGYPDKSQNKASIPLFYFSDCERIAADFPYANVPAGSRIEAVWYRAGNPVLKLSRKISGPGPATFELKSRDGEKLAQGDYEIWIKINGRFQARTAFTIN
jgi:hypothetical protein